jgi:hypothetical protein
MGKYANIKYSKFTRGILIWLAAQPSIEVKQGHKHVINICHSGDRPFTVPKVGNEINRHIISDLQKHLEKWGVCDKNKFDEKL